MNKISESHRKELLKFLLVKTAGVRLGIKSGELLRVQHCYTKVNKDGLKFCLHHQDVLDILKLDYIILSEDASSSLVLFYHQDEMTQSLKRTDNLAILQQCGYPVEGSAQQLLEHLTWRFTQYKIPHEVGVFIGYPAKDVQGFIDNLPRTPIHRGVWSVFGDAEASLAKMRLYGRAEQLARRILEVSDDVHSFFERFSKLNSIKRSLINE